MRERLELLFYILLFGLSFYRINSGTDVFEVPDDGTTRRENPSDVLAASAFGDFRPLENSWLNVTGYRNDTGFAWNLLDSFRDQGTNLSQHVLGRQYEEAFASATTDEPIPVYHNMSGQFSGDWRLGQETSPRPSLNISHFASAKLDGTRPFLFGRNLTSAEGDLTLELESFEETAYSAHRLTRTGRNITVGRFISATLEATTTTGEHKTSKFKLYGVHFPETGHALLSSHSAKFSVFGLSHLLSHSILFNISQQILIKRANDSFFDSELSTRIQHEVPQAFPKCELVAYLQQIPVLINDRQATTQAAAIAFGENELRFPTGAGVPHMPELHVSLTAFSPDCGYSLHSLGPPLVSPGDSNHLDGLSYDALQQRARDHSIFLLLMFCGQLWLLVRQMRDAHSSAMLNRISVRTAGILLFNDGVSTVSLACFAVIFPRISILLMATTCLGLMRVLLGAQLMIEIWALQRAEYEDRPARRETSTANALMPPDPQAIPQEAVPPVRIIDTGVLPVFLPPQNNNARSLGEQQQSARSPFETIWLAFALFFFLAPIAAEWSPVPRRIYFGAFAMTHLSFWLPQIFRNAVRNCRRALRWEFVIGQSLLRYAPLAYVYGYGSNVLTIQPVWIEPVVLLAWLWLQGLMLASQEIIDPRWFVKSKWLPPVYDYHAVLLMDAEGGNLPIGALQPESEPEAEHEIGKSGPEDTRLLVFDCAICMQSIEAPVVDIGAIRQPSMIARRAYMLTPCRHIFHTKCLESWMKFWQRGRLPCPICREDLPAM